MRKAIGSLVAAIAGAILLTALWHSRVEKPSRPVLSRSAPPESSLATAVESLPLPDRSVRSEEIGALVRQAAAAYRARDEKSFREAYERLLRHGSAIQRLLAELILNREDSEERLVAVLAHQEVATAEIAPFALALVRSALPDEIRAIAVDLLAKFRVTEASPILESLLGSATSFDLRRRILGFFAEIGSEGFLARAALDPAFGDLRDVAAKGLSRIGTPRAAHLLLDGWRKGFTAEGDGTLADYRVLESLATFDAGVLRDIAIGFLENETDPSAKNVFLSALGRADRSLALEILRDVLARESAAPIRQQAIAVLGAMGGVDAQEMLVRLLTTPEAIEGANALLQQDRLEVSAGEIRERFEAERDPLLRAALAGILAKCDDPSMRARLQGQATEGLTSANPAIRGLSIDLSANLARHSADPTSALMGLYGSLSEREREAHPTVFAEMSKRVEDPRVGLLLESTVTDDRMATPHRLLAADALLTAGAAEPVYRAIASSQDSETATLLSGIALARGGEEAAARLDRIAAATQDPVRKQVISDRLKAWSAFR